MSRCDPYLYEDVPVLKNLPGIKNSEELKQAEGDLTRMSMGIVYAREYDKFNTETLCDIHRTIFGGLYEWAGEFRTIPIRKSEEVLGGDTVRYALPSEIKKQLDMASREIAKIASTPLRDVLERTAVDEHYFLRDKDMPQWIYAKGAKYEKRRKRDGSSYYFSEGSVQFPEALEKPSRTMLTSESQVGRSTHVVRDQITGRLRVLTPVECERLNGFPDGWTDTGMPEKMRYFCMGNALVVPLVKAVGQVLASTINEH